ncbi:CapA family protein [Brevibacillus dissolubilis]|uniref:CapA family protein n=1 Tax=Brevibacillus dissolubilis TaxID=1844116 RepID=UPI0021005329|nr:CapA family protein [Brevibacillus dissolubilis]
MKHYRTGMLVFALIFSLVLWIGLSGESSPVFLQHQSEETLAGDEQPKMSAATAVNTNPSAAQQSSDGGGGKAEGLADPPAAVPAATNQPTESSKPAGPIKPARLTLTTVGDIMVHQEQIDAAYNPKTKSYDFTSSFAQVIPLLTDSDLTVGNLETTLAGQASRYTGYPQFNSPESLAQTLTKAGFDVLTTANNHSLDRREAGVLSTLNHLKQAGILSTGTFSTPDERNKPLFVEKNGIKIAFLAYTYGTNGIPIPKGKPYLVNLIDPALIKKDITAARSQGADIVSVSLHFGNEYQRQPSPEQRKMARFCLEAGADLILGHHPHVVQPYEWQTIPQADGTTRRGLIMYSLGNFISGQRGDYKDVGAILQVTITKPSGDKKAVLQDAQVVPTYVHLSRPGGKRSYVIYPLPQTLAAQTQKKSLPADVIRKMDQLYRAISVHLRQPATIPKQAL